MNRMREITRAERALASQRLVLVTAGLAPVVALVLIGLNRLERVTPDWVYWKAELIFLIALEIAYEVTALLSLVGALALGFALFRRNGNGIHRPWLSRGFMLCVALLCSLALSEVVCAAWISRFRRYTAVPVGGLGIAGASSEPAPRFTQPVLADRSPLEFPRPAR